jgi:peptide deformylase
MPARDVLQYPDPRLKTPALPVADFDETVAALIADMLHTLDASPGVALAAPQIGANLRVIVVDVRRDAKEERRVGHGLVVLVNPVLLAAEEEHTIREGCLSVPDFTANIRRYRRVLVQGLDRNGQVQVLESEGYEAIAFQHELDHLDGLLFLDRVASVKSDLFPRRRR